MFVSGRSNFSFILKTFYRKSLRQTGGLPVQQLTSGEGRMCVCVCLTSGLYQTLEASFRCDNPELDSYRNLQSDGQTDRQL